VTCRRPRRKPEIVASEVGNQTMLYVDCDSTLHVLNPVARFIWDRCDGEHTPDEIAQEIRDTFYVPEEVDVSEDVCRTLDLFMGKRLLV
jgi:hypothetical protein